MHNVFSSSIFSFSFSKRASFLAARAVNISRSAALGSEDKLSPERIANMLDKCFLQVMGKNRDLKGLVLKLHNL